MHTAQPFFHRKYFEGKEKPFEYDDGDSIQKKNEINMNTGTSKKCGNQWNFLFLDLLIKRLCVRIHNKLITRVYTHT